MLLKPVKLFLTGLFLFLQGKYGNNIGNIRKGVTGTQ